MAMDSSADGLRGDRDGQGAVVLVVPSFPQGTVPARRSVDPG